MTNPTFTTQEEVMFFDTDIGGVVHNLAYLRMVETCRTKLATTVGFQLKEMADTGIYPVVVRTEADYRKPATLGDHLTLTGKITEHTRTTFWCEFEVRNSNHPEILYLTCRQKLAVVQMPQARPIRIPAAVLAHLLE